VRWSTNHPVLLSPAEGGEAKGRKVGEGTPWTIRQCLLKSRTHGSKEKKKRITGLVPFVRIAWRKGVKEKKGKENI